MLSFVLCLSLIFVLQLNRNLGGNLFIDLCPPTPMFFFTGPHHSPRYCSFRRTLVLLRRRPPHRLMGWMDIAYITALLDRNAFYEVQ